MTMPVTCSTFNDTLPALLEHEVGDAVRVAMERHAVGCDACGALLADLRALQVDAASLPALTPGRDLWDGIAARLDTAVIPLPSAIGTAPSRRDARAWPAAPVWRVAGIAAAALIALSSGTTYLLVRGSQDPVTRVATPPAEVATVAGVTPPPAVGGDRQRIAADRAVDAPAATAAGVRVPAADVRDRSASPALAPSAGGTMVTAAANATPGERGVEKIYATEIARLRAVVDQRRDLLDPVTIAVVERNLRVIDDAIVQCRKALAKDPASRYLSESLHMALENKVELLRTAATLPSRT